MGDALSFELRIIRVTWAKRDHPLAIEVARHPIPVKHDGTGWVAEVPAYPVLPSLGPGQLAVGWEGEAAAAPMLILADDRPLPLVCITASDGRQWWIEKGKWRKDGGYHDAPLCRHAGEARLRVGDDLIRLEVYAPGFAGAAFDALLDEFRNGAWQLILEPASPTRATDRRADGGVDPAFLEAVSAFIHHAGRALAVPHRELREIREPQRIERVRPHTGTFRELATRGAPRLLSGRGHAATFDTPENRQLLAMCRRLARTLRALRAGAEGAVQDLARQVQFYAGQVNRLADTLGWAKVDERGLDRFVTQLESELDEYSLVKHRLLAPDAGHSRIEHLRVRLTGNVNLKDGESGFSAEVFSGDDDRRPAGSYRCVFLHPLSALAIVFRKGFTYTLSGSFADISLVGKHWKKIRVLHLTEIDSGDCEQALRQEVDNLRNQRSRLTHRGYLVRLNAKGTEEQRRDLDEARRSVQRLQAAGEYWRRMAGQLMPPAI